MQSRSFQRLLHSGVQLHHQLNRLPKLPTRYSPGSHSLPLRLSRRNVHLPNIDYELTNEIRSYHYSHYVEIQRQQQGFLSKLANRIPILGRIITPFQRSMSRLNAMFKARPLLWGAGVATVKSIFADLFAQCGIEGKSFDDVNWKRNALFGALGLIWSGWVHYFIYSWLYPRMFSFMDAWHWFPSIVCQSAFDQSVHSSLIYYPFFYAFKSCVYDGFSWDNAKKSVNRYWNVTFWHDVRVLVSVWFPANLITFGVIPQHLRVPWLAAVSFAWIVILSVMRGEKEQKKKNKNKNKNNNNNQKSIENSHEINEPK